MSNVKVLKTRCLTAWMVVLAIIFSLLIPGGILSGDNPADGETILTLAGEIDRRGLGVGDAFTSDGPLWGSGGTATVVENGALHITNRSEAHNGIDIRRDDSGVQVGDVIRVEGHVDGTPPAGTTMILGGAEDPWSWADSVSVSAEDETFVLEITVSDAHMTESQYAGFRIQTDGNGVGMDFYIDSITITRPVEIILTLAGEIDRRGLGVGEAFTSDGPLWESGGTATVVENGALHITNRSEAHNGIDIRRDASGVQVGDVIWIEGHVDGTPPDDTTMILGGAEDPWSWADSVSVSAEDETFVLEITVSDAHMTESQYAGFRIQTDGNGVGMDFYIDSIVIVRSTGVIEDDEDDEDDELVLVPDGTIMYAMSEDEGIQDQVAGDPANLDLTPHLQPAGDVIITIAPHPDVGNSLLVDNREADWNAVDFVTSSIELEMGNVYEVTFLGRTLDNVPDETEMMMQGIPAYLWMDNRAVGSNESFERTYEFTMSDATTWESIRFMTNGAGEEIPFIIDDIIVTRTYIGEVPEFELDPRDLVYSLDTDDEFQALDEGVFTTDGFTYLDTSGDATTTVVTEDDKKIVYISDRVNEWCALDVLIPPLELVPGNSYRIVAEGRVDGTAVEGSSMVLVGASEETSTWAWLQNVAVGGLEDAEFSFDRTVSATELLTYENIRFQSNDVGKEQPFYITSIEIYVAEPEEPREWDMDLPSLADTFSDYFLIGNIWSTPARMEAYNTDDFVRYQFNAVTAENAHKPGEIAPNPDPSTWNWTHADSIVEWAEERGMEMIGHTLIWHSQSPMWMTGRTDSTEYPLVTRQEAMDNMELFISTYAGRYAGRIYSWDVVNEVFPSVISMDNWEANPNWREHLRRDNIELGSSDLQWFNAFANNDDGLCGSDFIFYAFYFARQADPNAVLYYNDYNEQDPGKSMAIVQMITEVNEEWEAHPNYDGRKLIEGFGMQSHHHLDQWPTNFDDLHAALQRYVDADIRLSVSELDITIGGQGGTHPATLPAPLTDEQQERLADAYALVMSYYLEFSDHIDRVSFWGLADDHSWRSWGHPLLFDGNSQVKSAFWAVINATPNISDADSDLEDDTDLDDDTVPQTGESLSIVFYSIGALVAGSGLLLGLIFINKRRHQ